MGRFRFGGIRGLKYKFLINKMIKCIFAGKWVGLYLVRLCCLEISTLVDVLFFVNVATVLNKYLGLCLFSSKRDEK